MVKEIKAFKCEITGGVFEDRERAVNQEFRSMMGQVGGSLPSWGSINPIEMMKWISTQIESGAYPLVEDKLLDALNWWKDHRSSRPPAESKTP
jgi:hypothetical protein